MSLNIDLSFFFSSYALLELFNLQIFAYFQELYQVTVLCARILLRIQTNEKRKDKNVNTNIASRLKFR